MDRTLKKRLLTLKEYLASEIRGQDHAIRRICSVLKRGELQLTKPGRPKGSFLFLGPTGVGKTEITLCFARHLFHEGHVLRFDMSEYQTQDSLKILLGSKTDEKGTLGKALSSLSQGTLLLDEIEKAHPRVLDLLLQILDAARITFADGSTADLSTFYVVLTSNIGSAELMSLQHSTFATMERHVLAKAQQSLRPELFARVTEKVVFKRLDYETQLQIAEAMIRRELDFHHKNGYGIELCDDVLSFLIQKGFHPRLGARPLRDAVERFVGNAIAEALLRTGSAHGTLRPEGEQLLLYPAPAYSEDSA